MFTDPQTVTVSGDAKTLARIENTGMRSVYQSSDGAHKLIISHDVKSRERSVVRLEVNTIGVDPLISTVSKPYTWSCHLVVNRPPNGAGFSDTELAAGIKALTDLVSASGFATRLLSLES